MVRRIYVDVNLQNDLIDIPNGVCVDLPEKRRMNKLVDFAVDNRTLIIGSVVTHDYDDHQYFSLATPYRAPHCIFGTIGWLKPTSLLPEKSTFVPNIYLSLKSIKDSFLKPDLQAIYFQTPTGNMLKNVNCALTLKNLIVDQSKDKEELVEFVIFGVALDKDVKETCISLIDFCQSSDVKNFKLRVVSNACAGTTAKNCEETIEALKTMNVEIVEASLFIGPDTEPMTAHKRLKT
jgi:hypothetical protein